MDTKGEVLDTTPAVLTATALPDSPIRTERWFQIFTRLARPSLDWIAALGAAHLLIVGYLVGHVPTEGQMMVSFAFIGGLYGTRTLEKIKNVY